MEITTPRHQPVCRRDANKKPFIPQIGRGQKWNSAKRNVARESLRGLIPLAKRHFLSRIASRVIECREETRGLLFTLNHPPDFNPRKLHKNIRQTRPYTEIAVIPDTILHSDPIRNCSHTRYPFATTPDTKLQPHPTQFCKRTQ